MWLRAQPKKFFADSIRKVVDQSNTCVEKARRLVTEMTSHVFVGVVFN
jgi:hypothetical protein